LLKESANFCWTLHSSDENIKKLFARVAFLLSQLPKYYFYLTHVFMITLYLIRHAETPLNANPITIGGQSPEMGLSDRGVAQAIALGAKLDSLGILPDRLHIFTSPYVRTRETARLALQQSDFGSVLVREDDLLVEFSQGEWQGHQRAEIYTTEQKLIIEQKNPWFAAPGGESWMQIQLRVATWVDQILSKEEYQDATIVVFSHGMTIRGFITYLLGMPPRSLLQIEVENTGITKLIFDNHGWKIAFLNK
jgi:ribonuclease H / adenosylcobalamin/alpha-ribazole phosphatase